MNRSCHLIPACGSPTGPQSAAARPAHGVQAAASPGSEALFEGPPPARRTLRPSRRQGTPQRSRSPPVSRGFSPQGRARTLHRPPPGRARRPSRAAFSSALKRTRSTNSINCRQKWFGKSGSGRFVCKTRDEVEMRGVLELAPSQLKFKVTLTNGGLTVGYEPRMRLQECLIT